MNEKVFENIFCSFWKYILWYLNNSFRYLNTVTKQSQNIKVKNMGPIILVLRPTIINSLLRLVTCVAKLVIRV